MQEQNLWQVLPARISGVKGAVELTPVSPSPQAKQNDILHFSHARNQRPAQQSREEIHPQTWESEGDSFLKRDVFVSVLLWMGEKGNGRKAEK